METSSQEERTTKNTITNSEIRSSVLEDLETSEYYC